MVLCTLHLLSLQPQSSPASLLAALKSSSSSSSSSSSPSSSPIVPIAQARVLRWMILPTGPASAPRLLGRNTRWDLLLILPGAAPSIPAGVAKDHVADAWSVTVGASAKMLAGYREVNAALLADPGSSIMEPSVPAAAAAAAAGGDRDRDSKGSGGKKEEMVTGEGEKTKTNTRTTTATTSSQNLEMTPELRQWVSALPRALRAHPVSMMNLLAFHPGKVDQYRQYGAAFSARVGARHGGRVKIVGRVVDSPLPHPPPPRTGGKEGEAGEEEVDEEEEEETEGKEIWDEIAYVHYPTVEHFAAMASDPDYQEVNRRYRLGALRDTFILCTVEIDDEGNPVNAAAAVKGGESGHRGRVKERL
ncbi:hypothetical protein F4778DRAFT_556979 [Xylariomycetidae sp. FL2044]|nr:hypothetical protein F4778DRAFT_556979 [Xylariomycetidae sp. FL2044]